MSVFLIVFIDYWANISLFSVLDSWYFSNKLTEYRSAKWWTLWNDTISEYYFPGGASSKLMFFVVNVLLLDQGSVLSLFSVDYFRIVDTAMC